MRGCWEAGRGARSPDGLMVGWWYDTAHDFEPLAYRGDLHQLIVGGVGGGKFTTALAPLLLGSGLEDQAVVVVDPKGEVARLVGTFFQKPFDREPSVHLLDPWDVCGTGRCAALTFLDTLTPENPDYIDDARALADAMVIPSGNENTHWDNAARNFLASLLLYLALDPAEKGSRDFVRLRELVTLPWALPKAYRGPKRQSLSTLLYSYLDCDLAGGMIRRGFTGMLNREEKERSGIISSLDRETAWIDSPSMAKVLRGASIDLDKAAQGGGKYFIVVPPDYFMTHRAWLRLCITAFARAFKRNMPKPNGPGHKRWRHVVIDEFPSLGEMNSVRTDIAIARGYGVKYHLVVQDLPQLKTIYGEGWESFINNCFQRVFAVNDMFTAEYVSRMLGTATVETRGQSYSMSTSYGVTGGESEGYSSGSTGVGQNTSSATEGSSAGWSETTAQSRSETISEVARPLCTPDEVRRLSESDQFMMVRGLHPIWSWRPPYWHVFPSLPDFSLKEVLDTVGREPKDEAERARFERWRREPFLMTPEFLPPQEPQALPPPEEEIDWLDVGTVAARVLLFGGLLAIVYWNWPSSPAPPPPAEPQEHVSAPTPPDPVRSAPAPSEPPPRPIAPRVEIPPARPLEPPRPTPWKAMLVFNAFIEKLNPTGRVDLPVKNGMRVALIRAKKLLLIIVQAQSVPEKAAIIDRRDNAEMPFERFPPRSLLATFRIEVEHNDPHALTLGSVVGSWGYSPDRILITFEEGIPYDADLTQMRGQILPFWKIVFPWFEPGKIVPRKAPPCDPKVMAKFGVKCSDFRN